MPTNNLLFKKQYAINNSIRVVIPTVGEILENEDGYYSLVSALTAMPIDYMVPLDDAGIDFTQINEYELFLILFDYIKSQDYHLIFDGLDLSKFIPCTNKQNGMVVLYDKYDDITIDRAIHGQIAATLRKIHHLEKNTKKPANKEAMQYMLERARTKLKRNKNKQKESELESLIVAMVNTEQYKYNYEGTEHLTILQFTESVRQVLKKVDYENKMYGVYSGTISVKDISQDDLNWLVHK